MKQVDHNIRALLVKAMELHHQGDVAGAESIYHEVLKSDPFEPNAWHLLGVQAWQRKDIAMAEEYVRKAISIHGNAALYYNNLGGILRQKGDIPDAIRQYEIALKIEPANVVTRRELGQTLHRHALALTDEHKWDEVEIIYRRVLQLEPNHIPTLNNLAAILQNRNKRQDALELYDKVLTLEPDNLWMRYNRAICYLTEQCLSKGWADFVASEEHWKTRHDNRPNLPWLTLPMWRGEKLEGKKILLWGDQGIGDEIVFASIVPDLIERGAWVTVECNPRLMPLFARSFPQATILPRESTPVPGSGYDYQMPGLWVTSQLRPTLEAFPDRPSFLKADSDVTAKLRERYKAFGRKKIIGLSWFTTSPSWGLHRSVPLPDMLNPLPLSDMLIIDMQYGDTEAAWEKARKAYPDLMVFHDPEVDQFQDMDMFAAQVAACDAVFTISNTTSHVAGALGVPAVVLMSDIGLTWYWFSSGDKSPWYPSLHLVRPNVPDLLKTAAQKVEMLAES